MITHSTYTRRKSWLAHSLVLVFVLMSLFANVAQGQSYQQQFQDEMDGSNRRSGPLKEIRQKYEELPTAGKFAATACAGYCGSKLALKAFVSAAKVAGAMFIATEVLNVSGALDDLPSYLDDHVQTVAGLKDKALKQAQEFRSGVREALQKEKVPAFGFACGAFVGMVG